MKLNLEYLSVRRLKNHKREGGIQFITMGPSANYVLYIAAKVGLFQKKRYALSVCDVFYSVVNTLNLAFF